MLLAPGRGPGQLEGRHSLKALLPGHSLRFKITVGTLLPLFIILALSSYLQYLRHRDLMLQELRRSAANSAKIVESSLRHAMMTNDRLEIGHIVSQISAQRGVKHLLILDKKGEIAVSPVPKDIGTTLDIKDPTCQACHKQERASQSGALVIDDGTGQHVLRNVTSIPKRHQCESCHDPDQAACGVLIMDFGMEEIEAQLLGERRSTILWSFGALALLALTISAVMRRVVVRPLERLREAVRRVGQGELSHRTGLNGNDEIGELSHAFDSMAEGLEGKAALEREVREHTRALQVERDKLATLNTIANTTSHSLHAEEVMERALNQVLDLLGLKAGWISLYDPVADCFRLVLSRGISPAFAGEEACRPLEGCISQTVQKTVACAILTEIRRCPRLSPQIVLAEGLTCHACVPLVAKGQVLGVLNVAASAVNPERCFTEDQIQLLTAIGQQVGVAIENARLYEELQRKETLRGQLIEQLWTVQEEERRRIARELHDHTGQALTSLLVGLKMLSGTENPAIAQEQAKQLRTIAAETLESVHDLAVQLRPSVLDDMGLVAATQHAATGFAGHFGFQVHFHAVGFEGRRLPPAVETTIYRIVQEALTNVAKHARAQNVDILLECRHNTVLALVEDDGQGFDVDVALGRRDSGHLGLFSMQERAALVGGHLTVESSSSGGATVLVEIPLPQEAPTDTRPAHPAQQEPR